MISTGVGIGRRWRGGEGTRIGMRVRVSMIPVLRGCGF